MTLILSRIESLQQTRHETSLERGVVAQKAARFLHLTTGPDGVHLRGRVDHLAGQVLRTALAGVGVAPDETRTKEQADADALIALAERATTAMAGIRPRRGGTDVEQDTADARVSGVANRPVVSILVPAQTFTHAHALAAAAATAGTDMPGPAGPAGPGVGGAGPVDLSGRSVPTTGAPAGPVEPAVLEDGTPIAMSQLAQALCDCQLGRIVIDADSIPLDLGRTTRLFTAAQRRAVIVRDRACAWNGCDVPAAYCEVHHIRWWDRDTGPSDYDNAVLLCAHHHHHVIHQHDLTITRHARVPWRDEGRLARDRTGQDTEGDACGDTGRRADGGAGEARRSRRRPLLPDEPVRYEFRERRGLALVNGPPR